MKIASKVFEARSHSTKDLEYMNQECGFKGDSLEQTETTILVILVKEHITYFK